MAQYQQHRKQEWQTRGYGRRKYSRDQVFVEQLYYRTIGSRFGKLGLVWRCRRGKPRFVHIILPRTRGTIEHMIERTYPDAHRGRCLQINKISDRIKRFLSGSRVRLTIALCDLTMLYHFQKRVLLFERRIPRGSVSTYKILARKLGKPNHARAIGRALAKNPFPLIVPCHRVIKSDGSLGGYAGGVRMKRELLKMEGIRFDHHRKPIIEKFW